MTTDQLGRFSLAVKSPLLAVLVAGLAGCATYDAPEEVAQIEPREPCDFTIPGTVCGTISAPLNYQDLNGEQIDVGFAFFPAAESTNDSKTLKIVGGGPGDPISNYVSDELVEGFRAILPNHSILFTDARGIGWSERLECDALEGDGHPLTPSTIQACAAQLDGVHQHYSTANTARDFERVRLALDLPAVDALAFSYGTNLMMVYSSMYPNAVRTLTLDGAYPPPDGVSFAPDFIGAYKRLFDTVCDRSGECTGDEVDDALERLVANLRDHPRLLQATRPETQYRGPLVLDVELLAALTFSRPEVVTGEHGERVAVEHTIVGALLHADRGDFSLLESIALEALELNPNYSDRVSRMQSALNWSVACPEYAAAWPTGLDEAERRKAWQAAADQQDPALTHPFTPREWGMQRSSHFYNQTCIYWPDPPIEQPTEKRADFKSWRADLPVLVVNGDYDVQTPNEDVPAVLALFDRAQFARFAHHGHAITPFSECAMELLAEHILNGGGVKDEDICIEADALPVRIYSEEIEPLD